MTEGVVFWIIGLVVAAVLPQFIQAVPERRRLAISAALLIVAGEVALWAFTPIAVAAWVNVIAVIGLVPLTLFWLKPQRSAPLTSTTPETRGPEPRDPNKDYSSRPEHQVIGRGRYRIIRAMLHDIGSGWDRGVWFEVVDPSGTGRRVYGWSGLDTPQMRRSVAKGAATSAVDGGSYTIRWMSEPTPPYESEVVAEEKVILEPTGPLANWQAIHKWQEDRFILEVTNSLGDQGPSLQGFRCDITGPGGNFQADDRGREMTLGLIKPGEFPVPKKDGDFQYPRDFEDGLPTEDLRDGTYTVYWTAWEPDPTGDWLEYQWIDVARDSFQVFRDGRIV